MSLIRISQELSEFTGLEYNGYHSRVLVTKILCDYIKRNNLNVLIPSGKDKYGVQRHTVDIIFDEKLKQLFNPDEKDQLTYFGLQQYIQKHVRSE